MTSGCPFEEDNVKCHFIGAETYTKDGKLRELVV
jgi:hypothetical protein